LFDAPPSSAVFIAASQVVAAKSSACRQNCARPRQPYGDAGGPLSQSQRSFLVAIGSDVVLPWQYQLLTARSQARQRQARSEPLCRPSSLQPTFDGRFYPTVRPRTAVSALSAIHTLADPAALARTRISRSQFSTGADVMRSDCPCSVTVLRCTWALHCVRRRRERSCPRRLARG
jgi:hypothetical protein